ncbi:MAG: omega-6 fatty acid desaturase (delta-12 desaturase) [Maribacter sp.]|jgi:omega-6 fatty acid desaturase (delta-12 desaturase)
MVLEDYLTKIVIMNLQEKEIKQKLKNWGKMIRQYQRPSNAKAVIQILNSFLPFIGIWILMYFSLGYSYIITFLLAVINGFFLVRIFIIQHDCGHQSFFKSRKWNNLVGTVCSFFSTIPFKYWASVHNFHHAHTGQLEHRDIGDIDFLTVNEYRELSKWGRFKYRLFRNPFILFGLVPVIYLSISNRFPTIRSKSLKGFSIKKINKDRLLQLFNNLALLGIYVGLGFALGWSHFFLIQLPIVLTFMIIAFWFFYVQHQHEETYMHWQENWDYVMAAIKGASYYKLPKIFQWLTGNIGLHHIHHLSAGIPNYNLVKCAKDNPILQQFVTVITFKESLTLMFHKLWDEESQRMISFGEYKRMELVRV